MVNRHMTIQAGRFPSSNDILYACIQNRRCNAPLVQEDIPWPLYMKGCCSEAPNNKLQQQGEAVLDNSIVLHTWPIVNSLVRPRSRTGSRTRSRTSFPANGMLLLDLTVIISFPKAFNEAYFFYQPKHIPNELGPRLSLQLIIKA